jgi:glycosyltransferase involved in cell wall biosynthesis
MRILQVIDSLKTGGAESLLVELCLQWQKRGLELEVFLLQDGNPEYRNRLRDSGIEVAVSSAPKMYSPTHARAIAKKLSDKRFDLVHVHLHPAQLWTALALRLVRAAPPGITTEHNTWNRRRDHRWYRPVDIWVYSQFRTAVCIGSSTKNNLDEWLGPGICPTCVIPNGVDLTRFRPATVPSHLPDGVGSAPVILCTGSLTDRKDQETLVRAIAQIEGVHVLLVGEGPLKHTIQHAARDLQVADRIHFLGVRHDIPDLIAASTLYVQPSRVDGFCIAALEAMAGGIPVIASDIPGLGELVGNSGLLFTAGDHGKLAECIRLLLRDSSLAGELGRRGAKTAQKYNIETTAAEYEKIFQTTTGKSLLMSQTV